MIVFLKTYKTVILASIIAVILSSAAIIPHPRPAFLQQSAKVSVLVTDKEGVGVPSLRQEDFTLRENGKPVKIVSFSQAEIPVSYGLIVDTTRSMRALRKDVILAAKSIVNAQRPED